VIPGLGGREQVEQTMAFYRTPIPAEFWQELRSQNLIHEAAPLPAAQA
jgi:D-threo-aldose 1-dehydrogenase